MQRELERFREEEALRVALQASARDSPLEISQRRRQQQSQQSRRRGTRDNVVQNGPETGNLLEGVTSSRESTNPSTTSDVSQRKQQRRRRRSRQRAAQNEFETANQLQDEDVTSSHTSGSRENDNREEFKGGHPHDILDSTSTPLQKLSDEEELHQDEEPLSFTVTEQNPMKRMSMDAKDDAPSILVEQNKPIKHPRASQERSQNTKAYEEEAKQEIVVLIPPLPNDLVLGIILARFTDEDTLHNSLPSLNSLWRKTIHVEANQLLWRRLCLERAWRQWVEWGLLTSSALQSLRPPDFKRAYWTRKRIRESGPYFFSTVYWKPIQRSMWTPKDANPVILSHHFRLLWFAPQNHVLYASTAHQQELDVLIEQMRTVRLALNSGRIPNSILGEGDHQIFWQGTYEVIKQHDGELLARVHVPMRRHFVNLELSLEKAGRVLHWRSLSSAPIARPYDVVMHDIPGIVGDVDREFWFKSGFLA